MLTYAGNVSAERNRTKGIGAMTTYETGAEMLKALHAERDTCQGCAEDATEALESVLVRTRYPIGENVAHVALCADCMESTREDVEWSIDRCEDCESALSSYNTDIHDNLPFRDVETLVFPNGDEFHFLPAENVGDMVLCWSCCDNYTTCVDCGDTLTRDNANYCPECDEPYCSSCPACCEPEYDGEDDFENYDVSVSDALRATSEPGEWLASLRAFGVEYETSGGSGASYEFKKSEKAHLVAEAKDEHCGVEFVSLPSRGQAGEDSVREILRTLRESGYAPNSECGTHFHLDMTKEDGPAIWRILAALRVCEDVIYAHTDGRWYSSWSRPSSRMYGMTITHMTHEADNGRVWDYSYPGSSYEAQPSGRYAAINCHALNAHQTIEIRALHGTDDPYVILSAVALCAGIADWASANDGATIRHFIGNPMLMVQSAHDAGFISDLALASIEAKYDAHDSSHFVACAA